MSELNKTPLIIGLVVVVVLFLFFGGGAMTGSMLGGGMMGQRGIGGYRMGHGWVNGGVQLDVDSYVTYPRSRHPAWLDDRCEEVTDLKDESRIQ